jgi:hypothetical protein
VLPLHKWREHRAGIADDALGVLPSRDAGVALTPRAGHGAVSVLAHAISTTARLGQVYARRSRS